jgi:hypothetical protein
VAGPAAANPAANPAAPPEVAAVEWEAAARVAVVVDVRPAVVVDKVAEEADARLVVAAADPAEVAEWEVEAVADVLPAVAGAAAAIASSLSSSGASQTCGAPFFC